MSLSDHAEHLHAEARQLLVEKGFEAALRDFGEFSYVGSYALNLMTWRDIDMLVIEDHDTLENFSKLILQFSKDSAFLEEKMVRFAGTYRTEWPRGVYLRFKFDYPEFGGEWKIDLWALKKDEYDKTLEYLQELGLKLTPKKRELILEMKHEFMKDLGRVPQKVSHLLYQAILLEEISDKHRLRERFKTETAR